MKQIKMFLFALVAFGLIFTSCSESEGDDNGNESETPTITTLNVVKPATGTDALAGDVVSFYVIAQQNANTKKSLTRLVVKRNGATVLDTETDYKDSIDMSAAKKELKYTFNTVIPASSTAGTAYTYEFTIYDKGDKKESKSKTINVVSATSPIQEKTAIMLYGQSTTTGGSYFSVSKNVVWKAADAKTNSNDVDIVYYYGSANKATLGAPSDATLQTVHSNIPGWSKQNATKFNKYSGDYDKILSVKDLETAFGSGAATAVTNLANGDVVAFKTESGQYGVLKVTNLTVSATGSLTFNYKVAK